MRITGFVRTSTDDGASWWVQNPRIDAADGDLSGYGYSGLVDLGPDDSANDLRPPPQAAGSSSSSDITSVSVSSHASVVGGGPSSQLRQLGVVYETLQEKAIVFTVIAVPSGLN